MGCLHMSCEFVLLGDLTAFQVIRHLHVWYLSANAVALQVPFVVTTGVGNAEGTGWMANTSKTVS